MSEISRRSILCILGAGGTATVAGPLFVPATAHAYESPTSSSVPDVLSPLTVGSQLLDAHLVWVGDEHGTKTVDFRGGDDRLFRVRICRRDDSAPKPVAQTKRYGLYLANNGGGRNPTDESHGLVVMALAEIIRRNEPAAAPAAVDTIRERWARLQLV